MRPNTPLPYHLLALSIVLSAITAHAAIHTETVQYRHGDTTLQGYLAYDDSFDAPRPGVLVVHEWWGLNDYSKMRTRKLAELGYVAFAADMYGDGKTTTSPDVAGQCAGQISSDPQQLRARAQAGLAVLAKHALTDLNRLAAIGYCFGGSTVMQLAYSGANVRGVVSFHGAPNDPMPKDIPNVKAKLLICHGADDPMISLDRMATFMRTLSDAGLDAQIIQYGGAVHSFTNPAADKVNIPGIGYSPDADRRSWGHMKQFFNELFGTPGR